MNKVLLWNILVNLLTGSIFVTLNIWALQSKLEETFVALSVLFGVSTILLNALFFTNAKKKK